MEEKIPQEMSLEEAKEKYPELAKMTLGEIVHSDTFARKFKEAVDQFDMFIMHAGGVHNLKRNPLIVLEEKGYLKLDTFKVEYLKVLDKNSSLPTQLRQAVAIFGKSIYVQAVKSLMQKYDIERSVKESESAQK